MYHRQRSNYSLSKSIKVNWNIKNSSPCKLVTPKISPYNLAHVRKSGQHRLNKFWFRTFQSSLQISEIKLFCDFSCHILLFLDPTPPASSDLYAAVADATIANTVLVLVLRFVVLFYYAKDGRFKVAVFLSSL